MKIIVVVAVQMLTDYSVKRDKTFVNLRQQIYLSPCDNPKRKKTTEDTTRVGRIVFAPTNDKNKSEEESAANAFSPVMIDAAIRLPFYRITCNLAVA